MTVTGSIKNKISRAVITAATVATAALLAFGGLSPVGAETYDTCTYGSGSYDLNDDCDTTTTTTPSSGTSSSSTSSSSSGTGSGSSSTSSTSDTTSATGTTVVLNDFPEYTASTGKSLSFQVGDVIHFTLNGNQHTITIKSFDANTLVVTIASTPTDVSVPMGQTVNYDVDQDGTPDIAITYSAIASDNSSATAVFRALAATSTSTATPTTSTGSSSSTSTGGTTATAPAKSNLWWVWLFPAIIGVALLIWAIVAARRRKAAAANGGGTTYNQF